MEDPRKDDQMEEVRDPLEVETYDDDDIEEDFDEALEDADKD